MDRAKVDKFRVKLEAMRSRIRNDATAAADQALESVNGELSHMPFHLGDLGSEEFLRGVNAVLAENEGYLAGEVRDALARIEAGTFGTCEHCAKPIACARLEAIPFVRHCIKCAAEFNGAPTGNVDVGRPRGPKDTIAPEGAMAEDRRRRGRQGDVHAVGDAGGGTAWGGLGGSNIGRGDPSIAHLQDAAGSGNPDAAEERFAGRDRTIEPIDYESEEDLQRYAAEERERDRDF